MSTDAAVPPRQPKPWEQQLNESSRAYAAFRIYRDMGPKRSIRQVAKTMDRHRTNMEEWSSKHAWVQRVIDYEAEQDRQRRKEQRRQLNAMSHRHATMAAAWQDKALKRLKNLDPSELKPAEALRAFMVAVKIEEKARQIPTRDIIPAPVEIEEELEDYEREIEATTTHTEAQQAANRADPEDDVDAEDDGPPSAAERSFDERYADTMSGRADTGDPDDPTIAALAEPFVPKAKKATKKKAAKKAKPKAKKKVAKKAEADEAPPAPMRVIDGGARGGPDGA